MSGPVESRGPPGAQSPFASDRCYRPLGDVVRLLGRRYPAVIARTGSCASPSTSPGLRFPLARGPCRLLSAPAGPGTFPTLSPSSVCRSLDPYPAVSLRCVPVTSRRASASPTRATARHTVLTRQCNFDRVLIFGAAVIHSCSSSRTCSALRLHPPRRLEVHRAAGPYTPRRTRAVTGHE
jgi:hypothetical protein